MSRTNIDYGIDLGTTNSAIARAENGTARIQKSDRYQKHTTPSCVAINKKGAISVGDDAYDALGKSRIKKNLNPEAVTDDCYAQFKRMMGTDLTDHSVHLDRTLTPEDLSAEVLKKLKSYVKDEAIQAAVITVPAKFENPQIDATQKAAELAGFTYCELLQEPIAASVAFGLSGKDIEGHWVVFDFGGGTFDAALLKVEEGIIRVLDTEGDNLMGGKNLDDAIVDKILLPWIADNYSIESNLEDADLKGLLRDALKGAAERIKIGLSNQSVTSYECYESDDVYMKDDSGKEVILDLTVTTEQYEQVVSPWFQKSIDITKELIRRKNLKVSDLERIVLVGGPTLADTFRRMLREQFEGTTIDTSVDPMTVVAEGAALFASTKKMPEELKTKDLAKAQLKLEHADTTVEPEEHVAIHVMRNETEGHLPSPLFVELVNRGGSWSSSRSELEGDADVVMVSLNEGKSNVFQIGLFDENGNRVPCEPEEFSILHGMNIGNAPLSFSWGIALLNRERNKKTYDRFEGLKRNQPTPATGTKKLKTLEDVNPAKGDRLRFEILQGEDHDEGVRAATMETLFTAEIENKNLPFLPAGSDVVLTISIDESGRPTAEAFFPSLDETFDVECPEVRKSIPTAEELAQAIRKAKSTVTMDEDLPAGASEEVLNKLKELQEELNDGGTEHDARERCKEELRKVWKRIDRMETKAEWPRLEQEMEEALDRLRELETRFGDGDQTLSAEFESKIERVREQQNNKLAENLRDEIRGAEFSFLREQPGWWISLIGSIEKDFDTIQWKNETKARMALDEAKRAIRTNPSVEHLQAKYFALRKLMQDPTVVDTDFDVDVEGAP